MTKQELQNDYPFTWAAFVEYFDKEGWGASSASNLSEEGFEEWYPDFLSDYGITSVNEYESMQE